MENTTANRTRLNKAADLLAEAAGLIDEMVGEDESLQEAYDNAYGASCTLYNRLQEMRESKMESDLGSHVHDPDVVADWKRRNPV
jgi:hypothetical protein